VYSKLDDIPYCFSGETSFINFCAIRSFPNTQIQRVIDDLEENWLPWADDIVRVLLQVTLGQVGAIRHGTLLWRHVSDWPAKLSERLMKKAEKLRNTPRDQLALGAVAKFVNSYFPSSTVTRSFSSMSYDWSLAIQAEHVRALQAAEFGALPRLRAKEALCVRVTWRSSPMPLTWPAGLCCLINACCTRISPWCRSCPSSRNL